MKRFLKRFSRSGIPLVEQRPRALPFYIMMLPEATLRGIVKDYASGMTIQQVTRKYGLGRDYAFTIDVIRALR